MKTVDWQMWYVNVHKNYGLFEQIISSYGSPGQDADVERFLANALQNPLCCKTFVSKKKINSDEKWKMCAKATKQLQC